jgi:prolyl oligopeptidase
VFSRDGAFLHELPLPGIGSAGSGAAPVLLRVEAGAGHGAGRPTSRQIEEAANRGAFLFANLGVTGPRQP